jgi:hypothetical protein
MLAFLLELYILAALLGLYTPIPLLDLYILAPLLRNPGLALFSLGGIYIYIYIQPQDAFVLRWKNWWIRLQIDLSTSLICPDGLLITAAWAYVL